MDMMDMMDMWHMWHIGNSKTRLFRLHDGKRKDMKDEVMMKVCQVCIPCIPNKKTPNLPPSRASGLGMSFLFRMSCIRDAPTPDQTQQSHCSWELSLGKPERNSKNGFDRPLNSQSSASPAADGSWPPCHSKLSPWSIGQWAAAAFHSNSQPWISCQGTPHHLGLEE